MGSFERQSRSICHQMRGKIYDSVFVAVLNRLANQNVNLLSFFFRHKLRTGRFLEIFIYF